MKTIVFTFGKFNPPTKCHDKIFNKMKEIAKKEDCKYKVFISPKRDKKDAPLTMGYRQYILRGLDVITNFEKHIKTPFDALEKLEKQGYTDIIMVVGDDRAEEFEQKIRPYIGNLYGFNSFEVISVPRDNNEKSSTNLREYIRENKWKLFTENMSTGLKHNKKERIFRRVRDIWGLSRVR